MKNTSKILSIILATLMIISIIPITAGAESSTSGTCGENATWVFDESTGTLTISGTGAMYDYLVDIYGSAHEIDTRPWVYFFNDIEHVVIEEGITHVGDYAFDRCYLLTTVTLPESLKSIGDYVFATDILVVYFKGTEAKWNQIDIGHSNDGLNYKFIRYYFVNFPVSDSGTCRNNLNWKYDAESLTLTIYGEGVLSGSLTGSDRPFWNKNNKFDGTREWEHYRYHIEKIVIADGVTHIGMNSFRYFPNLKEVVIPTTVTEIGQGCITSCDSLSDVYYLGTEEEWNNIKMFDELYGRLPFAPPSSLYNATIHYKYSQSHTHTYETFVTQPTCTQKGSTVHICINCGYSYRENLVDALGHNEVIDTVVAPTCTKQGYTNYKCIICDESRKDDYVDALGHIEVIDEAIEPTCTQPGYTEGSHCSVCNQTIIVPEYIPALGHNGNFVSVTEPTCLEEGYTTYKCTVCGYTYKDNYVSKVSHSYTVFETIAPTCTEQGYTTYQCSNCGDTYNSSYVATTAHSYIVIATKEPTCSRQGYTTYECTVCGHKINDDYVGPVSHNYVWSVTKNPTCSTFGEETGVCSYCGKKTTKTIMPAHDWSETKFDYEPTCTTQGRTYVECLVCGLKTSYKYVPATGHNYSEWVQIGEATCQEYGKFEHYCLICGETGFMSAKGEHDYSVETIIVEPTCTTVGSKTIECSLCGDTYNEEIPITGHSHNATITEPTCTEQGYTTYTCDCGDTYTESYVDALGHTEVIDEAVAPSCTETGLTEGAKCSVCSETLTEQKELPANGHTPANAIEENYVAPTCTENGSKDVVVYCSVCNEEISRETVTIDATGHSYTTAVTVPTCTEQGYTTYTCSCGDNYVDDYVNATGHADNDGDGYCDKDNELLDPSVECDHACHDNNIIGFIWKILCIFIRFLGVGQFCECGAAHY